jgi:hypothetical protein
VIYAAIALAPGIGWVLHALVALGFVAIYRPTNWKRSGLLWECTATRPIWFRPSAQTHGPIVFYAGDDKRTPRLLAHERAHVLQSWLFGMYYPLTYLAWFAVAWIVLLPFKGTDWRPAYRTIPWESWARWCQRRHSLEN